MSGGGLRPHPAATLPGAGHTGRRRFPSGSRGSRSTGPSGLATTRHGCDELRSAVPRPSVHPMPPRAAGPLPWAGAGFTLLRDPTAFFVRLRRRLGDTFVVDAFGYRLVCVFSAAGVRALYALPEETASKGLADLALLRHKLPDELLRDRRLRPHDLFGGEDV